MAIADIQSSFGAGELSPSLYGRVDLAKYEVGAALLRNFLVDYRGGVRFRPGSKYIAQCKNLTAAQAPRLLPFIVSTDASYVLEVGNLYIRVYSLGALVQEVVTPYVAADITLLKYAQSADVMTLTHPSYPPATLTRTSPTTFVYDLIAIGAKIGEPTSLFAEGTSVDQFLYSYVATAVSIDGKEESVSSTPADARSQIQDETKNWVVNINWDSPAEAVSKFNVYKWGPIKWDNPAASVWGLIGSTRTNWFTDNNIAPDYTKEPPQFQDPFSGGQLQSITPTNGGSGYEADGSPGHQAYQPLTIVGDGTGAVGFAVIRSSGDGVSSGFVAGAFFTSPGVGYTTATVTCTGAGGSGAVFSVTISDIEPLYPSCVAYIQQRQVFAAPTAKPETLIMSQTGNYTNFDTTPISLDTDAISLSIASLEINTIKSMVPVSYGLIIFTTGGTYLLNGGTQGAAITPSSVTIQSQASEGANDVPPLRINYDVLYIQNKGNRVRDLAFAWQRQSYTGSDISSLAAHLFDGFTTVEWCWSQEPFKVVSAVRSDGKLLMCTYVPDQEVYAWSRHDTQGQYKSICSIPEGEINAVYTVVQRYIPAVGLDGCCIGWVNYLERFMPTDCCIYDAWFLDAAVTLPRVFPDSELCLLSSTFTLCNDEVTVPDATVIQVGCALLSVHALESGYHWTLLSGDLLPYVVPGDTNYVPIPPGSWSYVTPTATITGLDHLEGLNVSALADGLVYGPLSVTDGAITLPRAASCVVVGLPYVGQVQTLYLNVEGLQPGTMQGKLKLQPAVTLRLDCSRGLECGIDFDHLSPVTNDNVPYVQPGDLMTGDVRHPIYTDWNTQGQICIQQNYPLPATILGIIAEVVPGGTMR